MTHRDLTVGPAVTGMAVDQNAFRETESGGVGEQLVVVDAAPLSVGGRPVLDVPDVGERSGGRSPE